VLRTVLFERVELRFPMRGNGPVAAGKTFDERAENLLIGFGQMLHVHLDGPIDDAGHRLSEQEAERTQPRTRFGGEADGHLRVLADFFSAGPGWRPAPLAIRLCHSDETGRSGRSERKQVSHDSEIFPENKLAGKQSPISLTDSLSDSLPQFTAILVFLTS
jgi:hypothetical protein